MYKLSLLSVVLAAVVVLLGAYTRLVDAGLGCPDWPGCYGFISVPHSTEDIAVAEMAFPATPVEREKAWPEMIHRYFAGSLGLLVAVITLISIKNRQRENQPVILPVILLGLICF
ncbi:MAG: COX15/CtaA family protein, partial [Candidatus Heimdallarchaeota archaeon]|nr:COX15/CtaA family protein [Candidatus Heimdallarchaeota archaeon]